VREVRVHYVESLTRAVDLLADRLRGGHESTRNDLGESDRGHAGLGWLREVGRKVGRKRAAVRAEAGQECCLRLPDNVSSDPPHHVVEAAVFEVIFDSGPTRPRDGAVDHSTLAGGS